MVNLCIIYAFLMFIILLFLFFVLRSHLFSKKQPLLLLIFLETANYNCRRFSLLEVKMNL